MKDMCLEVLFFEITYFHYIDAIAMSKFQLINFLILFANDKTKCCHYDQICM